jgi:SAM-dependent methyltransferase
VSKTLNIYFKRYLRYVQYFLSWLILEKPRGLDFSMRQKSVGISSKGNHGYALTSRKAVKNILRDLPIGAGDSFLDVGCGKGGVLCFACEFPFGRIAGIEIEPRFVDIARRNVEVLQLRDRVEVIHADALIFEHYDEFNFFFFFNPFDPEIYGAVLARIFRCLRARSVGDRTVWLLCYGESSARVIESSGFFGLYRDDTCPYRGNALRVWRSRPGSGRA